MKKVIIGTKGEGFDLEVLLPTRLLIQANSGGGKSYLIRKLVEQIFGRVQVIILDPEGEFASLREKFDFVLAGKGGDTPADPRSAALLATKLLELNASAVCDIYELRAHDRSLWVKNFLDSLINAPKNLWHSVVVVVDEAHVFAPEKGQGESIAYQAMADLATRGRKRGFCAVFATQRLGKLSKNVSAELQNVLIGSTFQDVDRKRAAETLGVLKSEERQFFNDIKLLNPGTFYALGRAISRERITIQIDAVQTSHPQTGKISKVAPPPTPDKIKNLLPKLADLPKEAEEKTKTEGELRKEITELKKQLKAVPLPLQKIEKGKEVKVIHDRQILRLETVFAGISNEIKRHEEKISALLSSMSSENKVILEAIRQVSRSVATPVQKPAPVGKTVVKPTRPAQVSSGDLLSIGQLTRAEKKILTALAHYPEGRTKTQLAILTGYAHSGGGFNNAIGSCKSKGFIAATGDKFIALQEGLGVLGTVDPLPEGDELFNYWLTQVSKAERQVLAALRDLFPEATSKEDLARRSGYEVSGGGFNNALGRLRSLELINGRAEIKLSENLV